MTTATTHMTTFPLYERGPWCVRVEDSSLAIRGNQLKPKEALVG